LLAQLSQLPADQLHQFPDSNAWAANGPAIKTGAVGGKNDKALLAGRVSVPGLPGVLIGHNARIAWSLTDTQNQATFFYERTKGYQYYWDGKWRPMQVLHYDIPVRGAATVHLTVDLTVHGPIMTQAGQTTSVDWMGNVSSPARPPGPSPRWSACPPTPGSAWPAPCSSASCRPSSRSGSPVP